MQKSIDKVAFIVYNIDRKKEREVKKMTVMNLWKSVYTNIVYEMPVDWLPTHGGWELVGTIEK